MATIRRKISELTALTSASLDTTVLGVDGGTTYRIELDTLADAVTARVNILDRSRLSSLESVTSSFETKGRNVISSSAQISALGFTTSSSDLTSLNSFTSSQSATNTALTNGINARLTTSSFESFSASVHSEILAATNEQDLSAYVTQLVVNTLSGSVDSRIDNLELNSGSYLTSLNGAISSSSQLTSSYDGRYVISGSITQTTWDNIANKPSGIVSQSTDLSSLNNFSASISTASLVNRLNVIESVSGSWITESETGSFLTNLNGAISSSSQLTSSYDARYTLSGSVQPLPSNLLSSSAQITSLGFVSGSYLTNLSGAISSSSQVVGILTSLNTFTASVSTASLSSSINNLNSYTSSLKGAIELTGSTVSFLGNIVVYGTQSVITSTNVELSDNILYLSPTASTDNDLGIVGHYNDGTYRHAGIFMDASDGHSWKVFNGLQTETTATVDTAGTGFTLADFKAGVITATSFNGIINATNGVISSSANLVTTSSFNSYTASQSTSSLVNRLNAIESVSSSWITESETGSFLTSLNGTISASSQITAFGFISSSTPLTSLNTFTGSVVLTSSFNSYTASISTASLVSSITNLNNATSSYETTGRGIVSGSSQLTSSLDTRYAASGSVGGVAPAGTVSGSSQLTSSLDLRYLVTGSVTSSILQLNTFTASNANTSLNTFTSSLNIWSSSLATTGSNSFNGNQTITGSLNVSSVAVISSSFTANSSSLTLNSGSNFYLQNNGIAEISGSLRVSGSLALTGSISISSGSIIMPNRPAFRVTGAGGPTAATTVLSGSMVIVDYNEGGHYNITNGTFTAPIAGLYQVNLVCRTYSNSAGASQAVVVKNNTAGSNGAVQIMLEWAANTSVNHMGGSTISKLAVGDTLKAMIFMGTSSFDGNDNFSVAYIG
jgi:hypothetical protein